MARMRKLASDVFTSEPPKKENPRKRFEFKKKEVVDGKLLVKSEFQRSRYTVEEVKRQVDFVEGLMVLGVSSSAIVVQASRPPGATPGTGGLGVSQSRVRVLIERIKVRWEEEDAARSMSRRSEAVRRAMRQIQNCQGRRDPRNPTQWLEKPNHSAILGYERHIAQLQGTYAPIQIDVNVQHVETLAQVFSRYSIDYLRGLHAKARAKERLAKAFLEEHPEARETIEAEGVTLE